MSQILESKNLTLRKFEENDSQFILKLLNSSTWLDFIGDRKVNTDQEAKNYLLNGPLKSYKQNNYGLWLVETKINKIPIGICGIIKRADLDFPDIGYAFLPEYTGKGFAYEISKETVIYAKTILKIEKMCALTEARNISSVKLLTKIDFKFKKSIFYGEENEELNYFENF